MARSISTNMGIGRGNFRKAFLSVLLHSRIEKDAPKKALKELGNECAYCGISGETEHLQYDHLWPESKGGVEVLGNLVPCCPTCNSTRRDSPWEMFMKTSPRVKKNRNRRQIVGQIKKLQEYMKRHDRNQPKSIEQVLTAKEKKLRENFNLLLAALSDSAEAAAGIEKKASLQFREPEKLFYNMVKIAKKYAR